MNGKVMAVWAVGAAALAAAGLVSRADATEAAPLHWSAPVVVATDEAHRGRWRMNESNFDFVDDPTVLLRPDGDVAVAWVNQARKDVLLQRYTPEGTARFERPVNVSATPEIFSWLPRLAAAPDDPEIIYALWQEIVFSGGSHGGEILFARSTDGGRSFEDPINLSQSKAGDGKGRLSPDYWHNGSLDIAVGPVGVVYAAWTEYEGRLWLARSDDAGISFTDPVHVAGGEGTLPTRGPSLALGAGRHRPPCLDRRGRCGGRHPLCAFHRRRA